MSRITPECLETIRRMVSEGRPNRDIGAALRIKENAVKQIRFRYGIYCQTRPESGNPGSLGQKYKDDLASRMAFLTGQSIEKPQVDAHFEDEELLRWSAGVEGFDRFCKEVLRVTMQPYQLGMTEAVLNNRLTVFLLGRGAGKDFWAGCFAVWTAIIRANHRMLIVSGAQRQSDLLMNRIQQHLVKHDKLYASVGRGTMETVKFTNNSEIYSLPSTSFVRGYQDVDLIIANEAAFISGSAAFVQSVLMPMLGTKGGKLCLMSTPMSSSSEDAIYWAFNSPLFKKLKHPSAINRFITTEFLEEQRVLMPSERYRQEYEAEFMDVSNCLFGSDLIDRCCQDYELAEVAEPGKIYYLGWDAARVRDASVVVVVSRDKADMLKVENVYAFERTPFPEQEAMIERIMRIYKPKKAMCEYAGLSMGSVDYLMQQHGNIIDKFIPTVNDKMKGYDMLKLRMEQGVLTLPRHQKLITELKFFQFTVSPSGNILLHHSGGQGDDYADALMFAVRAAEKKVIGISEVDLHHGSGWRIAGKETYDRLIAEGCKPEDLRGFAKT